VVNRAPGPGTSVKNTERFTGFSPGFSGKAAAAAAAGRAGKAGLGCRQHFATFFFVTDEGAKN
jgi:hypothetical protein